MPVSNWSSFVLRTTPSPMIHVLVYEIKSNKETSEADSSRSLEVEAIFLLQTSSRPLKSLAEKLDEYNM